MKLFPHLIIILIISSCSSNRTNKKTLKKIDEIDFPVGFAPSVIKHFAYNGEEYVGFADFKSFKKIKLFNINARSQYSFSIKDIIKNELVYINGLSFSSPDSIALLSSSGTSKLFIVNKKGEVIYKKDYSFLKGQETALYPPIEFKGNQIRVGLSYYGKENTPALSKEYYDNFFKDKNESYIMMSDTLFRGHTLPTLQMDSLYMRFIPKSVNNTEMNHLLYLDTKNIFYSTYSDSVYEYDLNGQLKEVFSIKSTKTKTKVNPISISEMMMDKNNLFIKNIEDNSYIALLLWDKFRSVYYAIIPGKKMSAKKTPFTILVLDEKFETLDEFTMNPDKYYFTRFFYYPCFVGKKGLYIQNQNKDVKNTNYSIFTYE